MPHSRHRAIEAIIRDAVGWSPAVGVIGARQTGKTTLLKSFSAEAMTFDDPGLALRLETGGKLALAAATKPLLLDEVQKYPPIFDLIKLLIDEKRRPGRFLLTGSVRFSGKKAIRESLTGRIVIFELLPMTLAETHSRPFKNLLRILLGGTDQAVLRKLETGSWAKDSDVRKHLLQGGMPGICFLRSADQRVLASANLLDTLFSRDIQSVRPLLVRPNLIRLLFEKLAAWQGLPANHSHWARELGLSVPTVKRIIDALESLFLVRPHGKTYFVEDQGLANPFANEERAVLRYMHGELRAQLAYHPALQAHLGEYRTRGGAIVPFVVTQGRAVIAAFGVSEAEELNDKTVDSLLSLKKKHPKARLVGIHSGKRFSLYKGILSIPWTAVS